MRRLYYRGNFSLFSTDFQLIQFPVQGIQYFFQFTDPLKGTLMPGILEPFTDFIQKGIKGKVLT